MGTYTFTLTLKGPDVLEEPTLEALYQSGCNDASFGEQDGRQFAAFDREADTFMEAVLSAIQDIESAVPTLKVVRVEPEEFVTAADIAHRTGRSRESVSQLVAGERGPGNFPRPAIHLRWKRPLWRWSDVAEWLASYTGRPPDRVQDAKVIAAVNAALDLRSYSAAVDAENRRKLMTWVGPNVTQLPESILTPTRHV